VEIANYLTKVGEAGQLTKESKRKIPRMMKLVSELESIGDSCYNLGRTLNHKRETNLTYTPEQYANITKMFSLIDKAIENMLTVLSRQEGTTISLDVTMEIERDINSYRKMLKERSLIDISENKYSYQLGVSYMDFINECEHLGDYIVNVVQASNYNIA
jgi:phosphate:Na+ symporter